MTCIFQMCITCTRPLDRAQVSKILYTFFSSWPVPVPVPSWMDFVIITVIRPPHLLHPHSPPKLYYLWPLGLPFVFIEPSLSLQNAISIICIYIQTTSYYFVHLFYELFTFIGQCLGVECANIKCSENTYQY